MQSCRGSTIPRLRMLLSRLSARPAILFITSACLWVPGNVKNLLQSLQFSSSNFRAPASNGLKRKLIFAHAQPHKILLTALTAKMFDVALKSAGAAVVLATSSDDNHPPENMIDGDSQTFWTSTGMFPQEFIITFTSVVNIARIELCCSNVKEIAFEKCKDNDPIEFEKITERELTHGDGQLQNEEISVNGAEAQHLRVVIRSAHDPFISIHRLHVHGNALRG